MAKKEDEYIPSFLGHGIICGLSFKGEKSSDTLLEYTFYVEGVVAVTGSEQLVRSLFYHVCFMHKYCGSVETLVSHLQKVSHHI